MGRPGHQYVRPEGVNGQRGSKPVSLDGPCNSPLSSSLTLSDGETLSVQGEMGVGVSPVNLVSSSSQAPAGLAVQQERKEPQNWAQDTQGRAAGFQTRCHLDPFSHPVQSNRALTGGFVTSSTGHHPPPPTSQRILDTLGGSMFLPSWRQQTWTQL